MLIVLLVILLEDKPDLKVVSLEIHMAKKILEKLGIAFFKTETLLLGNQLIPTQFKLLEEVKLSEISILQEDQVLLHYNLLV